MQNHIHKNKHFKQACLVLHFKLSRFFLLPVAKFRMGFVIIIILLFLVCDLVFKSVLIL